MSVTTMQTRPLLVTARQSVPADTADWPLVQPWPQGAWQHADRPGRGNSRRAWVFIGAAAAVIAALVATLVAVLAAYGGAAATPAAGPAVTVDALPAMLLDPVAVNEVMRATAMAVNPALTSTALYEDTTDKPECGGVSANANLGVYSGSGWSSAQTRYLREPTEPTEHEVFESVIGFSSADAAAKFVAAQSNKWPVCNGRYVTTTSPRGVPRTRWVSTVSQENGMLTASSVEEGGRAWVCQHALTARNNVVVDVQACGSNVMQQGAAIAKMLADRIQ